MKAPGQVCACRVEAVDGCALKQTLYDLGGDLCAAGRGRSLAREALSAWNMGALADDAVLIVSELVGNALRHGVPPVGLLLRADGGALTITVGDRGNLAMPLEPELPKDGAESGRGLAIVAALADSLEFSRTRDGHGLDVIARLRTT